MHIMACITVNRSFSYPTNVYQLRFTKFKELCNGSIRRYKKWASAEIFSGPAPSPFMDADDTKSTFPIHLLFVHFIEKYTTLNNEGSI
jgi:hypothetical protein